MLPLVVSASLFGFALSRVEGARRAQAIGLFQTLAEVMVTIVRRVLVGPLDVFALAFGVCVKAGASILGMLAWYVLAQCTLYIARRTGSDDWRPVSDHGVRAPGPTRSCGGTP